MSRRLLVPAALLLALAASVVVLLGRQGQHPLAARVAPPACGALAAAGTGGFTLAAPAAVLDEFDARAVRCAVALGTVARADVAVLTSAAIAAGGGDADTSVFLEAWLKGEGLAGTRFEPVPGPWRAAHAEGDGRAWRRIVVDDNGVLVAVAPQGLDAAAGLQAARDIVEALRAAPP
jgi:hypothetical protein